MREHKELFQKWFNKHCRYYASITWVKGPNKDMAFYPSHLESDYEHIRGSYENHPQFGDIDDDMHQIDDIMTSIVDGNVIILDHHGKNVTQEASEAVHKVLDKIEGIVDFGDEDLDESIMTFKNYLKRL